MIYTITFNPALDYVLNVGELRYDDINRSENEAIYYGGKGINVSVVLTRLGVENRALGFIAGFTGKELERMLKEDGIKTDFNLLKSGRTRINVKIRGEGELDINASGAPVDNEDIEALFSKLDGVQSGDFVVLAGSVPSNLPSDIYESIMKRLEGRNVNFVVDASGEQLLNALKFKPFLIKPNHLELGELFGAEISSPSNAEKFAKLLQEKGAKNVLVSLAEMGAVLVDETGTIRKTNNAEGELVNSTGCGDSMLAGFLAGYIKSGDYETALKLGTACGNATAYSPSLAEKSEIEKIYNILK